MNKSLLMLLAVAIMGTNLVAKTTTEKKDKKSCWSCCTKKDKKNKEKSGFCGWERCDKKKLKEKCKEDTAKKL